jgi:hypothetical protein
MNPQGLRPAGRTREPASNRPWLPTGGLRAPLPGAQNQWLLLISFTRHPIRTLERWSPMFRS